MATCGPAPDGYCMNRYHEHGCGSAATPDIVEQLKPQLEMMAARPHLGPDGQPWLDQEYGSPMTLLDHVESQLGVRLGDASLWESHRGQRRPLAQAQRPLVHGNPDDPDAVPLPFPADTMATAAALAAQAGISTSADAQAQQAAWVREHDRQAARYRGPRHMDWQEHTAPARQAIQLSQVGDEPWNGSLPVYSLAGAA